VKAILTYHSIDESRSVISVSPTAFRRHVLQFLAAGIPIVPVEELLSFKGNDAVALTFDDGYLSVEREAMPLLMEHDLPATVFVVTSCVGGTNTWAAGDGGGVPQLPLLDWEALGGLNEHGVTVASHSRTHPYLPSLTQARMDEEIGGAARDLSDRLGITPHGFAYPYGAVCPRARAAAGRAHDWACTTVFGEFDGDARLDLPRIDMWYFEREGLLERWGTPWFRRWVRRRRRLRQVRSAARRLLRATSSDRSSKPQE